MLKNAKILVLGAGQIGLAACFKVLEQRPKELILHTLTKRESAEALEKLMSVQIKDTKLTSSHGDIFACSQEFETDGSKKAVSKMDEIEYLYGMRTKESIKSTFFWKLLEAHQPDMIVDAINTATAVGYCQDPYTAPMELFRILKQGDDKNFENVNQKIEESLLSQCIPKLIRFIQILSEAMTEFKIKRYVKVSTTGLGGMGFNIKYTHGDRNEPGFSRKLLGKVAAAGVFHQLLWTLSHTPEIDIRVVIPNTLVGWEDITCDVKYKKDQLPLVDCKLPLDLADENSFNNQIIEELEEDLKMVVIDSGENFHYARGDMTTITSLGQMGCITKEEVGIAVVETLEGSTKFDILTALDSVTLGPSFNAGFQRDYILAEMKKKEKTQKYKSITVGNLGALTTKYLLELEILRRLCKSLEEIVERNSQELAIKAENLILQEDIEFRRQILSLQMPILLDKDRFLIGKRWHIPESVSLKEIFDSFKKDKQIIENWAKEGWVDIREEEIRYWQSRINRVIKKLDEIIEDYSRSSVVRLQVNRKSILLSKDEGFDIGEVLGFIYSIEGGKRKLY